jgi:hypothetical protein
VLTAVSLHMISGSRHHVREESRQRSYSCGRPPTVVDALLVMSGGVRWSVEQFIISVIP